MKRANLFIAITLFVSVYSNSYCQVIKKFWQTDGAVNSIVRDSLANRVYLGGSFSYVGPYRSFAAVFDTTGNAKKIPDLEVHSLNTMIPDGKGGWYIGGWFSQIGDSSRNYFAQIDSSGNVTSMVINVNGYISSMAKSGDTLFIGGSFTTVDNLSRAQAAAIKLTTMTVLPWNPSPNYDINTILPNGNTVLLGGSFSTVGGATRNNIAQVDRVNGNATSWAPSCNGQVKSMVKNGNSLFVSGYFTSLGGSNANLACIDLSSGNATSLPLNVNNVVNSMVLESGILYIGGGFTSVNSSTRTYAAAINANTGAVQSWSPILNNGVVAIGAKGNTIVMAGSFTTANNVRRNYFASVDKISGALDSLKIHSDNTAYGICVNNNRIAFWGGFTSIGGVLRSNVCALNFTSGKATNFHAETDNPVNDITLHKGKLYIAGTFGTVNNINSMGCAAVDTGSSAVTSLLTSVSGYISTIAAYNNSIFLGGNFGLINTVSRSNIAEINDATGNLTSWDPSATSAVHDFLIDNSTLYIAGAFTTFYGYSRPYIAAVDLNTMTFTNFNPNAAGGGGGEAIFRMAKAGNTLYIGGSFSSLGGSPRDKLASIDLTRGSLTSWAPTVGKGFTYALAADENYIYTGGDNGWHGTYDLITGNQVSFNPAFGYTSSVFHLGECLSSGGYLFVGGLFTGISNFNISKTYFAAFCNPANQPGIFTQAIPNVCAGSNNIVYAIPAVSGATTYNWKYSGKGVTINGSLNLISLNFSDSATSGILSVNALVPCGTTSTRDTSITVHFLPKVKLTLPVDTLVISASPLSLNTFGTPSGGNYTGAGVTNSVFIPSLAGVGKHVIHYSYTDQNGCSSSDSGAIVVINHNHVGIGEYSASAQVKVFPNPTTGNINLIWTRDEEDMIFEVSDVAGRKVFSKTINSQSKNTCITLDLNSGIYLYKITFKNTSAVEQGKLIIERNN